MRCIHRFVMILAVCCLLGLAVGCEVLDQAVQDLGTAGQAARAEARNPAAPLNPDMRTILEGFGLAVVGVTGLYAKIRYGDLSRTSQAIVRGIQDTPAALAQPAKQNIEKRMMKTGKFDKLNALVDQLKGA